jgi:hypothetical protein
MGALESSHGALEISENVLQIEHTGLAGALTVGGHGRRRVKCENQSSMHQVKCGTLYKKWESSRLAEAVQILLCTY